MWVENPEGGIKMPKWVKVDSAMSPQMAMIVGSENVCFYRRYRMYHFWSLVGSVLWAGLGFAVAVFVVLRQPSVPQARGLLGGFAIWLLVFGTWFMWEFFWNFLFPGVFEYVITETRLLSGGRVIGYDHTEHLLAYISSIGVESVFGGARVRLQLPSGRKFYPFEGSWSMSDAQDFARAVSGSRG